MQRILLFTIVAISIPIFAHAAEPCVRYATAQDVELMRKAGNNSVVVGGCIDAAGLAIIKPQDASAAKDYLKSLPRPANTCRTNSDPSIENLNNDFAICAAQFMQAYTKQYNVSFRINSAYRSSSQQACVCPVAISGTCGAVGQSNHQRGLAMDIVPLDGNFPRLWAYARANPSFGVCFPLAPGDRPHIILAGIGGVEGGKCAKQGVTRACTGATVFPTAPSNQTPGNGLVDNVLRSLTGQNTQTAQCQQMQQQCQYGNSGACTAYAYQCQGQTPQQQTPPRPPSSPSGGGTNSGTSGIGNAFGGGTSPTTPPPITPTTTATTTSTSTDIIEQTLGTITIGTTPSSTPQNPLSPTTVIQLAQNQTTLQPDVPVALPPDTVPTQQNFFPGNPTFAEGRFVSDGENFEETHALPTSGATGFTAQLAQFRAVLETILAYLQPFSPARYSAPTEGHDTPIDSTEFDQFLETTDNPASLFDDNFEFPAFGE